MNPMNKLQKLLEEKKVLVADGGWGTELIKKGLKTGEIPEEWNRQNQSLVKWIAKSYIEAGADIILTNTFGANSLKLKISPLSINHINKIGVELSKEEARESLVFASIGPTGKFLKPVGNFEEAEFIEAYSEQVKGIIDGGKGVTCGGADGVIIETMSDIKEALCALKAVRKNSSLPVGVTFSFNKVQKGFATIMGVTPEQAILAIAKEKPDIIGANCGSVTVEDMVAIAKIMKKYTSIPLWIKPNAGLPVFRNGKTLYPQTPEDTASFVPQLIEAGVKIIGGCCGTTPEHIKQIRKKVDEYLTNSRRI